MIISTREAFLGKKPMQNWSGHAGDWVRFENTVPQDIIAKMDYGFRVNASEDPITIKPVEKDEMISVFMNFIASSCCYVNDDKLVVVKFYYKDGTADMHSRILQLIYEELETIKNVYGSRVYKKDL